MKVSRREFGGLLGSALVANALPELSAQDGGRKFGYCIVGLGRISMDHFMPGIRMGNNARITGIVSGHRDKAERVAAEYGVPQNAIYGYENCDAMRDNRDIDGVYIALPNSMHAEYTIRAAHAGKHVLCEKPMATSVKDAKSMIDACRKAEKKLMIAYRCQLEPTNLRAIELIRSGRLGTVQAIESGYGFNIRAGEWRLNRKLAGGGPLMDVGIYALNACRYLTGEEPTEIAAHASVIDKDGRFEEVEENAGWTMKFPSGIVASCNTTYGAHMEGFYRVHGSKGVLHTEPAFAYEGIRLKAEFDDGEKLDELESERDPRQFLHEGEYFADCVIQGCEPKMNGGEGLRDMELIGRIYQSCGIRW
jgi:predicted dehydrogenase